MESTPRLHDTLVDVLRQHQNWVDLRHLKTLTWMVVGLMQSRLISLTAWPPLRAQPSRVRAEHRASVCALARE